GEVPAGVEAEQPAVVDDDAAERDLVVDLAGGSRGAGDEIPRCRFCAACPATYVPFAAPLPVQCSWSSSPAGWPWVSRRSWYVPRTCRWTATGKEQLAGWPG